MAKIWKRFRKRGFTLVELLVVIAIIGILVSIVMPAITTALFRGKLTQAAANGRNMSQSIISKQTENIYTSTAMAWPVNKNIDEANLSEKQKEAQFDNSSEYFAWLVTNGTLSVNYNFFALSGVPAASSEDQFLGKAGGSGTEMGDCNAWCVVSGIEDSTPDTMPVLFTRNLRGNDMGGSANYTELTMTDFSDLDQQGFEDMFAGNPFGEKGFVFVTKGGAAYAPFKSDMLVKNFTNLFKVVYKDDVSEDDLKPLPVLRPGSNF